ncbi:hypothetical protein [uncultured Shewanella sp.]|uniref:hypothetical protein n=1 Tax=uncultured Shewanella sp. TaxID=173975 RepID=UPI002604005F|nr:hypothetical protein [uncultured Shewanella sp.]
MSQQGSAGNVIAAIASFFIPGLGQLVQGRVLAALLFFVFIGAGYAMWFFIIPGIVGVLLHIWCIVDAATYKS